MSIPRLLFYVSTFLAASTSYADISECYSSSTSSNTQELRNKGYQVVSSKDYEVVYQTFGNHYYWKSVNANIMKNPYGSYAIANCKNSIELPYKSSIQGSWKYCSNSSIPCSSTQEISGNGNFVLTAKTLEVDSIGGAISTVFQGTYELFHQGKTCYDPGIPNLFKQACRAFRFRTAKHELIPIIEEEHANILLHENQIQGIQYSEEKFGHRAVFSAGVEVPEKIKIIIKDKPDRSGIIIEPKSILIRGIDFGKRFLVINESSLEIDIQSPVIGSLLLLYSNEERQVPDQTWIETGSQTSIRFTYPWGEETLSIQEQP